METQLENETPPNPSIKGRVFGSAHTLGDHLGSSQPSSGDHIFETKKMGGKCLEYCSVPSYKAPLHPYDSFQ